MGIEIAAPRGYHAFVASVKFNPEKVVVEAEDQEFEYDYPEGGLIIVTDDELKFDYLVILPGDEELEDGVYKLSRVGDVEEVAEIPDEEGEEEDEAAEEEEASGDAE